MGCRARERMRERTSRSSSLANHLTISPLCPFPSNMVCPAHRRLLATRF
jgi:hypothetical protein